MTKIPKKYSDESHSVTHYVRQQLDTKRLETASEEPIRGLPTTLGFILPNGIVLKASVEREISIGRHSRDEDPAVIIDFHAHQGFEYGVSRFHAVISVYKEQLVLRDLNSVNGTLWNEVRCTPLSRYGIRHNDVLTFGQLAVRIVFNPD